jgi:hypothetical protein
MQVNGCRSPITSIWQDMNMTEFPDLMTEKSREFRQNLQATEKDPPPRRKKFPLGPNRPEKNSLFLRNCKSQT